MKRSERPKEEIEEFEHYGFVWKNTSVYDDDYYGAGHWHSEIGYKIVPVDALDQVVEYTILQFGELQEYDYETGVGRVVRFPEGENVCYCGYLDLEDREFTFKLFQNLGITFELEKDEEDDGETKTE